MPTTGDVEAEAGGRAEEGRVEGEHSAVGPYQPVPAGRGVGGHRRHGGVADRWRAGRAVGPQRLGTDARRAVCDGTVCGGGLCEGGLGDGRDSGRGQHRHHADHGQHHRGTPPGASQAACHVPMMARGGAYSAHGSAVPPTRSLLPAAATPIGLYSQRNVAAAATGAASAHTASTSHAHPGTAMSRPSASVQRGGERGGGEHPGDALEPTGKLRQRRQHPARQQQQQPQAVGGGEVHLGAQQPGQQQADAPERRRVASTTTDDRPAPPHRHWDSNPGRVPRERGRRPGSPRPRARPTIFAPSSAGRPSGVVPSLFRTP